MWDGIFADLADNDKIIAQSNITSIISKNMKRRFPVVIKYGTTWEIVYEYDSDIEENSTTLSYNKIRIYHIVILMQYLIHMNI